MLLPAILATTILCTTQASQNIFAEVQAFITKFHELNETADVLNSLENMGDNARELSKLGQPVRELLAGNDLALKDEAQALDHLHALFLGMYVNNCTCHGFRKDVKDIYEGMELLTSTTFNGSVRADKMRKIKKAVDHIFTAPYTMMDPYMYMYYYTIHDFKTILKTVDYNALIVGCRMATEEESAKSALIQNALRRLESRVEGHPPLLTKMASEYRWSYEFDLLYLSLRSPMHHVEWMVSQIDMISDSGRRALYKAFYPILRESERISKMFRYPPNCDARNMNTLYDFNHTAVLFELRKIHSDLIRLMSVLSILQEKETTDEIVRALDQTGNYIALWFRNIQDQSWPKNGVFAAKKAINDGQNKIVDLNRTAIAILEELEHQGSKSFSYQVVILPAGEAKFVRTMANESRGSYANVLDFNGIDIHIFRSYQVNSGEKESRARIWLNSNYEKIFSVLRFKEMYVHSFLRSMTTISSNDLKNLYRSVILVRKTTASAAETNASLINPYTVGYANFENVLTISVSASCTAYFFI